MLNVIRVKSGTLHLAHGNNAACNQRNQGPVVPASTTEVTCNRCRKLYPKVVEAK
jgi:hypothetical protein